MVDSDGVRLTLGAMAIQQLDPFRHRLIGRSRDVGSVSPPELEAEPPRRIPHQDRHSGLGARVATCRTTRASNRGRLRAARQPWQGARSLPGSPGPPGPRGRLAAGRLAGRPSLPAWLAGQAGWPKPAGVASRPGRLAWPAGLTLRTSLRFATQPSPWETCFPDHCFRETNRPGVPHPVPPRRKGGSLHWMGLGRLLWGATRSYKVR